MIQLTRVDPARNMRRFYRVYITPTLFNEVQVWREWGRIGRGGMLRIWTYPDRDSAEQAEQRIIRQKLCRGYVQQSGAC